jgi:RNA polymerase sigma-70 factor (ECF subfamily)
MKNHISTPPACDVPALWLQHKTELRNYIHKRVKDTDLTHDILQEVFIKVYSFCLSKSGIRNVRSWLFQIAHNCIIDHYRRKKIIFSELPDIEQEDENTAFSEVASFVQPLLGFLPRKYALPLKLSDMDGMKQAEVAKKLGLSLTATKSRIQRARQLLKSKFLICLDLETDKDGNLISASVKNSCKPLQELIQNSSLSCCTPSI